MGKSRFFFFLKEEQIKINNKKLNKHHLQVEERREQAEEAKPNQNSCKRLSTSRLEGREMIYPYSENLNQKF